MFWDTSKIPLKDVPSKRMGQAVDISAKMEDLVELALNQNFVPVVDDMGIFIGIVTRKAIMTYFIETNLVLNDQIKSTLKS